MSNNSPKKYDEEFKKSLVTLFQNGKTRTQLSKEYGISQSALAKWIKQIFHCGNSRRTSPDCKANQRASKTECAA